jgi:plastocyanin
MTAAPPLLPRTLLASGDTYGATAKSAAGTTVTAAAASTGVTIKDFKFGPASSSVHVGDTITWTNQDVAAHTATASDGSFNTGSLSQGKSGSHTFTKAGTFPYICSIHPSMKGTVTVAAASGGTSGGTSGTDAGAGGGTTATPSASSGSSLPQTGLDLAVVVLLAALMMAAGTALRRTAQ